MNTLSLFYLALTGVSFFWGTSFAAAKIGMHELSPINLGIFRAILAAILFSIILVKRKRGNTIERKDIPKFILLGFLVITSYFYLHYTGLSYTTTINAALIVNTSPIFTALLGTALGWEKIRPLGGIGIMLAFAGVSLIITNGQLTAIFQSATLLGNLLLLSNAIVWAGFTLYGKELLQKYSPITAIAYIHIFGAIMLLPFAFFPTAIAPVPFIHQILSISWKTVGATLYLAILCSVYGYYMWYTGVGRIGPVKTAVFGYLNPLFAILSGIWLLGEKLTVYTIIGGILVISGVYLTNQAKQATSCKIIMEKS